MQKRLRNTNERLQLAQDVADFSIWDWNPAQDKLFRDRRSFALFGYPGATDAEAVWTAALPEAERELRDANERLAAALEGGQFGTFEHVIGRGD